MGFSPFIIFSTMFREGVTEKGHQGLEEEYRRMRLSSEYKKLEFDKTKFLKEWAKTILEQDW